MAVAQRKDGRGPSLAYLTLSHKIMSGEFLWLYLMKLEWLSKHFENPFGQKGILLTRPLIRGPEQLSFLL